MKSERPFRRPLAHLGLILALALLTGCAHSSRAPGRTSGQAHVAELTQVATRAALAQAHRTLAEKPGRQPLTPDTVALVATPSNLGGLLNESNRLGLVMQEVMIGQCVDYRFAVVEHRMSENLRSRGPEGEFILSRDVRQLVTQHAVRLILTGTYSISTQDTLVTLRVLDATSGEVLGSSQFVLGFDPRHLYFTSFADLYGS